MSHGTSESALQWIYGVLGTCTYSHKAVERRRVDGRHRSRPAVSHDHRRLEIALVHQSRLKEKIPPLHSVAESGWEDDTYTCMLRVAYTYMLKFTQMHIFITLHVLLLFVNHNREQFLNCVIDFWKTCDDK